MKATKRKTKVVTLCSLIGHLWPIDRAALRGHHTAIAQWCQRCGKKMTIRKGW